MQIFKLFKEKSIDFIIIVLLCIRIESPFFEENYISYDELYSLINYTNIFTLFLKDNLNNHVVNSLVGIILSNFTYQISLFRLISYIIFLFATLFLIKTRNSNKIIIIILLFLLISNNFFVYSFLYRGYPYNLLLFSIAFYLLSLSKEKVTSNLALAIFSVLTFLAPSNILLIFPVIFFYRENFKIKNILIYYFLLTTVFLTSHIIVTGIYGLRETIEIKQIFYNVYSNPILIYKIFYNGIVSYYDLIFGFYQERNFFDHIKIFLRDDKLLLILFLIFFLNIFIKKLKSKKLNRFDKIFIWKIMLMLFLSNAPVARIYYPFYVFYILYLDEIFSKFYIKLHIKNLHLNLVKLILITFLFFNFSLDFKLKENYDINLHYTRIKTIFIDINPKDYGCKLNYKLNDPLTKDIFYYKYLLNCGKKIDIFEIKKFQKNIK